MSEIQSRRPNLGAGGRISKGGAQSSSKLANGYTLHGGRGHKTVSVSGKDACLKIKGIREDTTAKIKSTQIELGHSCSDTNIRASFIW